MLINIYVYTYILCVVCMYVYVYIYIHTLHTFIYITYIYIYIYIYTHTHIIFIIFCVFSGCKCLLQKKKVYCGGIPLETSAMGVNKSSLGIFLIFNISSTY